MKRIGFLVATFAVLLLGGCGSITNSTCSKESICPIVIYETLPGRFATYPENMTVRTGGGSQTLLWTFADTTKYKFSANTDNVNGDGIELLGVNGSKIGVTNCFVTRNSRLDFKPAQEGAFYRCEVFLKDEGFKNVPYRIRFRTMDGSPRMVDPTVSSTGGADADDDLPYTVITVASPLVNDQVITLPKKTTDIGGFRVIWDSGSGSLFRWTNSPMVFKDDATGAEVNPQPCSPSTLSDGSKAEAQGRYYRCDFSTSSSLSYSYVATYVDNVGANQTRTGKVKRP